MSTTTTRFTKADLPEGYAVERQEYEFECQHPACATVHRHLFNTEYADGQRHLVDLYDMSGYEYLGNRWDTRFHMTTRVEWVILLNGERVGDTHDTKREAMAEAVTRRPTI